MIRPYLDFYPKIAATAYVDPDATVIGRVSLAEDCSIWPQAVLRGDIHTIDIGARSNIQDGAVLHVTHASDYNPDGYPVVLEHNITIGHHVTLHGCHIQHHCLIGMGSVVLDGALLEPFTLLGAGSLVAPKQRLDGGYLWLGSPAKKIRPLTEQEKTFFAYSAQHYATLSQNHR